MFLPQLTSGPSSVDFLAGWPDSCTAWRARCGGSASARTWQLNSRTGPGYDYQPDWSSDGKRVVFARHDSQRGRAMAAGSVDRQAAATHATQAVQSCSRATHRTASALRSYRLHNGPLRSVRRGARRVHPRPLASRRRRRMKAGSRATTTRRTITRSIRRGHRTASSCYSSPITKSRTAAAIVHECRSSPAARPLLLDEETSWRAQSRNGARWPTHPVQQLSRTSVASALAHNAEGRCTRCH